MTEKLASCSTVTPSTASGLVSKRQESKTAAYVPALATRNSIVAGAPSRSKA
ncbi:hypothetical protein KIV56_11370 [Cryobacterium breve]|uniref:Uncharacterized protein n=1 Tax=Cryobacterium breve TaxID=1259258 RepID=A0ABY7NJ50_9MICO|nr:hypothetical protein [Cryobacterium breve]WBM81635.1 hypothetical protein KIV56_11370 [Cryobacterium breve]